MPRQILAILSPQHALRQREEQRWALATQDDAVARNKREAAFELDTPPPAHTATTGPRRAGGVPPERRVRLRLRRLRAPVGEVPAHLREGPRPQGRLRLHGRQLGGQDLAQPPLHAQADVVEARPRAPADGPQVLPRARHPPLADGQGRDRVPRAHPGGRARWRPRRRPDGSGGLAGDGRRVGPAGGGAGRVRCALVRQDARGQRRSAGLVPRHYHCRTDRGRPVVDDHLPGRRHDRPRAGRGRGRALRHGRVRGALRGGGCRGDHDIPD